MEESKPKEIKQLTQEQLNKMDYKHLRQEAIERDLNPVGLPLRDLKLLLGAAPANTTVVNNAEGMSPEDLEKLYVEKKRVPKKTIYYDKDDEAFWKMREKNPFAFDNVDFTDKTAKAQHVFNKKVKCTCGEKFKIERVYTKTRDGVKVEVVDKNPMDYKRCPKCKRMYYYHDPDVDSEIYAV